MLPAVGSTRNPQSGQEPKCCLPLTSPYKGGLTISCRQSVDVLSALMYANALDMLRCTDILCLVPAGLAGLTVVWTGSLALKGAFGAEYGHATFFSSVFLDSNSVVTFCLLEGRMISAAFSRGWEGSVVLLLVPYWKKSLCKAGQYRPNGSTRRTSVVVSPKFSRSKWPRWYSPSEVFFWDGLKLWVVTAAISLLPPCCSCCFPDLLCYCRHSGALKAKITSESAVGFPSTICWWWLCLYKDTQAIKCVQGHIVTLY